MKDNKPKTESFDQWESWAQRTYRNGGTQPPKSHGGLVAFLLVVIIFLCGISTALGLMNIRLFHQLTTLSSEETCPVVFSHAGTAKAEITDAPLGFLGQEISVFWQNYHGLPQGIYVTKVLPGSNACKQGVLPGDVLVSVDGIAVSDPESLQEFLAGYEIGDTVEAKFCRHGQDIVLTLILE